MRYSLSAVLLASALGAAPLSAYAGSDTPLAHSAQAAALATLASRGAPLPLMIADTDATTGSDTDNAATPATPDGADTVPATPNNPIAYDETQDHRPGATDLDRTADLDRPAVDRPEVERPDVDRPQVERPEVERPEMSR